MKEKTLLLIFRSWVIGAVVVVVHFLLHLQHFFIGLILGLVNTFFTEPFSKNLDKSSVIEDMNHKKLILRSIKNIIIAVSISLIIRGIDYILVVNNIFEIPIEPFRFIILYQLIYYGFQYLITAIKKRIEKSDNNE